MGCYYQPGSRVSLTPGWLPLLRDRIHGELGADVIVTRDFDHISEILRATCSANNVAVFGGDGTIAEVVNRMSLNHQRLLLLPGGTGNGLARDLGLTTIDHALAAVRANAQCAIDVLQVTFQARGHKIQRLAISTAALGYAAEIVLFASRLSRPLGTLRYALASIFQAVQMPAYNFTVQINNQPPQERYLTNIMINNTRHAGNFLIFHSASLSDGHMNALLSGNRFWQQMLENLAVLARIDNSKKDDCKAKSFYIHASDPMRLMLDGETWDDVNEVSFNVLSKRLRCYFRFQSSRI
jgi:diacylglycerol kinase (ATP)